MSDIRKRLNGALDLFGDLEVSPFVAQLVLTAVRGEIEKILSVPPSVLGPKFDAEGRLLVRCRACKTRGVLPLEGGRKG